MSNPNDGTTLGTSEVISDEYADPTLVHRRDPDLPQTAYKIPRSKIAVGPYGDDWGDATIDMPLPVESRTERRLSELASMRDRDRAVFAMVKQSQEYVSMIDCRGHHMATRGVR